MILNQLSIFFKFSIAFGMINFCVSLPHELDLLTNLLRKINMTALASAARDLNVSGKLAGMDVSTISTETILSDGDLTREMHHLLFEVHVMDGSLVCPESGRKFPVKDGIPNMLLHEDEI